MGNIESDMHSIIPGSVVIWYKESYHPYVTKDKEYPVIRVENPDSDGIPHIWIKADNGAEMFDHATTFKLLKALPNLQEDFFD